MKNDSGGKKYILNIEQKAVKIIVFICLAILAVVFSAGYFTGKTVSFKNSRIDNQSNVLYKITPPDTSIINGTFQIADSGNPQTAANKDNGSRTVEGNPQNKPAVKVEEPPKNVESADNKSNKQTSVKKTPLKSKPVKKNRTYLIEVYSYKTSKEAESFRDILKTRGCDAYTVKSGKMFKVRIGKFKNRRDAVYEARRLESKGIIPHFYIQEE